MRLRKSEDAMPDGYFVSAPTLRIGCLVAWARTELARVAPQKKTAHDADRFSDADGSIS
jgi:hypothetical protein